MNVQSIVSVLLALLCLSCVLVSLTVAQDTVCDAPTGTQASSTCTCETDDQKVIDLSPLANTDGTARFTGLKDANDYTYDYNPCKPFSEGPKDEPACKNVFLCQTAPANEGQFTAADNGEQIYKESTSGKYYVKYGGPSNRETKVYLNCDQCNHDGTITSIKQAVASHYVLQLASCHACPGGCSSNPSGCGHGGGGGGGGSGTGVQPGYIGIALIIVIIITLVAYFIVGALLLKFQFDASGTDVIPNKSFWVLLPLLIKDGFVFTFGPCVKFIAEKAGRRNDYQKI